MSISAFAQNGTITHLIYISKENRSFDSYFGSFPGVQSYCTGGHSPARTVCYAPSVAGCTIGDTCPYPVGSGASACGGLSTGGLATNDGSAQPLLLECASTTYHDISHTHTSLLSYVDGGAMDNFHADGCTSESQPKALPAVMPTTTAPRLVLITRTPQPRAWLTIFSRECSPRNRDTCTCAGTL